MVKKSFLKNVLLLVGGTTLAQVISILASPILTRLYTPLEYGVFALFTSVCAIFAIISSLTLEQAISLPHSNNTASGLFKLAVIILICVVTIVLVLTSIAHFGNWDSVRTKFSDSVLLIPIVVFFTGLFMISSFWAIRHNHYENISKAKVVQVLTQVAGQILLSIQTGTGLIFGYMIGIVSSSSYLLLLNRKFNKISRVSWLRVYASLRRYRRFPIFSTWEVLFNALSLHSAPIIFALFMGSANAGFFALSFRIMSLPVSIIGTAVGHGLYGKAADLKSKSFASALLEKIVVNLFNLALVGFIPIFLFAPDLFSFAFGAGWEMSGIIAQWIAIWVVFQLVASPLSAMFPIYEQQVQGLVWQFLLVVSRLGALYLAYLKQDFMLAVALYCCVSAVAYLILLLWVALLVEISIVRLFSKLIFVTTKLLMAFAPLFYMKFNPGTSPVLASIMCLTVVALLATIYRKEVKKYVLVFVK